MPQSTVGRTQGPDPGPATPPKRGWDVDPAKEKANRFRAKYRRPFTWKPPSKPGVDKDWDTFESETIAKPPEAKGSKLTDITKK